MFEPGDRVVCIKESSEPNHRLEVSVGNNYTVKSVHKNGVFIQIIGGKLLHSSSRFRIYRGSSDSAKAFNEDKVSFWLVD